MKTVSIIEAKTDLSKLVRLIETGKEDAVIIQRHGKPVAKMVFFSDAKPENRIGVAKGKFRAPSDLDKHNDEVAAMFGL